MSTPVFLLAGLGVTCAFAVLALLTGRYVTPRLDELRHRRLERRLSLRLARGHDSHADELREIEAGLAPRPVRPVPTLGERLIYGAALLLWGPLVVRLLAPEDSLPRWTRPISSLVFVFLGLQLASGIGRAPDHDTRLPRIIGLILIVVGLLFLAYDLSRVQRGLAS